jgi:acyl-CoA synthetase (NDP forming)
VPPVDIHRLIAPRSIALIGAGAWTDAVAAGNLAIGYSGALWRVHPTRRSTAATTYYRSIADLPGVPDAAFLAVPNHEVPGVAGALAAHGAGGFVCFTAGFSETGTESGNLLTRELVGSAGALPFFGPNCYGFVNFFDRVAMMPDQIVGPPVERGVALICQSGTIALTLMFNHRSLPIGYLLTVGNQTGIGVRPVSRGYQGSRAICACDGSGACGGQAHCRHQIRTHCGRRAHRAQSHRGAGGRRPGVRSVLPPGGNCPLRYLGDPVRNAQAVSYGRPA